MRRFFYWFGIAAAVVLIVLVAGRVVLLRKGSALDAGMDMLTKPFALDVLGAKVRAMIEG